VLVINCGSFTLEGHEPSDLIAQGIDRKAQAIVEGMYQRTLQILEEHHYTLETLAQYLFDHEVIDQQTLAILLRISTVRGTSKMGYQQYPKHVIHWSFTRIVCPPG